MFPLTAAVWSSPYSSPRSSAVPLRCGNNKPLGTVLQGASAESCSASFSAGEITVSYSFAASCS